MCTLSISNVIYHKFSHGAAFYTLNGKNVNLMLEYMISCHCRAAFAQMLLGGTFRSDLRREKANTDVDLDNNVSTE